MGVIIEAVRTARMPAGAGPASSVALAVDAARATLESAACAPEAVGILVNTGIYRDDNICEPAMAPFIQRGLGMNARASAPCDRTFSFDLNNGACGLMTGIEVVAGFIESGAVERGLVVTSDADPTPGASRGWCFDAFGGAVLLRAGPPNRGFAAFRTETTAKYSNRFEAEVPFVEVEEGAGGTGDVRRAHALRMRQGDEFVAECARCTHRAITRFLIERDLELDDLDLIVASEAPVGFPRALEAELGAERTRFVAPHPPPSHDGVARASRSHTAGPALALESAMQTGEYRSARNILLAAAGSGITTSLALYCQSGDPAGAAT